ncbi:hypothetical protein [Parasphingorhabdus pacifica]
MRRTTIALSAVALTMTLGACSQGTDNAQPAPDSDNSQSQEQGPFNDAVSLASNVDSSVGKNQSVVMNVEVVGAMQSNMECQVDIKKELTACTSGQVETILTPDATYSKMPGLGEDSGKPWTKYSSESESPMSQSGSFGKMTDFEALLPPGTTITNSAPEQVAGEETTRYDVVVDVEKAMAEAEESQRQMYQAALDAGVTETTATTWVNADGLPVKVESTTPAMEVMGRKIPENTTKVTYKDWGKPVNIELPPADQVQER